MSGPSDGASDSGSVISFSLSTWNVESAAAGMVRVGVLVTTLKKWSSLRSGMRACRSFCSWYPAPTAAVGAARFSGACVMLVPCVLTSSVNRPWCQCPFSSFQIYLAFTLIRCTGRALLTADTADTVVVVVAVVVVETVVVVLHSVHSILEGWD